MFAHLLKKACPENPQHSTYIENKPRMMKKVLKSVWTLRTLILTVIFVRDYNQGNTKNSNSPLSETARTCQTKKLLLYVENQTGRLKRVKL